MGEPIQTFWLEDVDLWDVVLRRYTTEPCPERGSLGHSGFKLVAHQVEKSEADMVIKDHWDEDWKWESHCSFCGAELPLTNENVRKAASSNPWYRRADTGTLVLLREAPPGAMWDASWMAGSPSYRRINGITLAVRLPNGTDWIPDGPPTGGGTPWDRSGDPRSANVTCSPSIAAGKPGTPGYYHGWLRDGKLVAAGDSRC